VISFHNNAKCELSRDFVLKLASSYSPTFDRVAFFPDRDFGRSQATHIYNLRLAVALDLAASTMVFDGATNLVAESAPVPRKRSLFKTSAYAKSPVEDEEAVDFFSRAKELFPTVVAAEQERKRSEKEAAKRKSDSLEREDSESRDYKRRSLDKAEDASESFSDDDDELIARQLKSRR